MLARIRGVIADLRANPPPLPVEEIAEAIQFLEWMADDNFTLLGARDYAFTNNDDVLEPDFETGLGLLRSRDMRLLQRWNEPLTITPDIRAFLEQPKLLIVTKSTARSRVHRRVHLDYIGVKRFDRAGKLVGEHRFCGLFTSTAYTQPARTIPYLRRKTDSIIRRAGFDPSSHSGKALVNVLETYPRDELFQIDEDTLYQFALAILQLDERPRVRVLPRRDRFDRFVSVLVYVPRDRYDGHIRAAIGRLSGRGVQRTGKRLSIRSFPKARWCACTTSSARRGGEAPNPDRDVARSRRRGDRAQLDRRAARGARRRSRSGAWAGAVRALSRGFPDRLPRGLFTGDRGRRYAGPRDADAGAPARRRFLPSGRRGLHARRTESVQPEPADFALGARAGARKYGLSRRRRAHLSHPSRRTQPEVWFHDMELESASGQPIDLSTLESRLEACFIVVMRRRAESDGYNALVLATGLGWRDVALIRTISRFLRQIRVPYSQDYMWTTLRKYPAIAAQIVALFKIRFDPHPGVAEDERARREAAASADIESALQAVESLDEDRILRRFVNAVRSAIRTNFYQLGRDGRVKELIAIKFASRKLDEMPLPRPLYEVFVYSPRVEAVHLRFGKVARGGIRWSDRPQDFRTEILGLVKAQNVKNAVIVPVGAKGGFVPNYLPAGGTREAIQAEGVATYKMFISTLLDITDNIGAGTSGVIPPADVVRHDGDDPYLVVAADKGTATFSDIANDLAIAHDYWLGDAFASGGSAGYDHKKMGITARGAWESVKRHFREMDVNISTVPFTVVGIGDMSGDVFGNGMLREKTTKLVAAFDHRDIFIDPDPDAERTFAERKRMFDLPRSSWQDFDKSLISKGGGVYPRSAKDIIHRVVLAVVGDLAAGEQLGDDAHGFLEHFPAHFGRGPRLAGDVLVQRLPGAHPEVELAPGQQARGRGRLGDDRRMDPCGRAGHGGGDRQIGNLRDRADHQTKLEFPCSSSQGRSDRRSTVPRTPPAPPFSPA